MTTDKKEGPVTQAAMRVANKADDFIEKSAKTKKVAKEHVKEKVAAAKEKVAEVHENARTYVQENPEKAVGIAAGVGALVGVAIALIITRRR